VLVVGDGGLPRRESETILRELKFAVAPAADVEEALKVVEGLHPDLIVARAEDAHRLRSAASVPIIEYEMTEGEAQSRGLVERLLAKVRGRR
jgi:CheY-like chemotaxis protein